MFGRTDTSQSVDFLELSGTIFSLAATRTGALIVFQRQEPLEEYLLHGIPLDSKLSGQLLATIFQNGTPLHDGALLIKDGRVAQASSHLPLSTKSDLPHNFGTRHRAAIGLTERSDAVVVVVSEERGEVSLVLDGELTRVASAEQLAESLHRLLTPQKEQTNAVSHGIRQVFFADLRAKVLVLLLVSLGWVLITGRQGEIVTVTAPLRFHNLPDRLALIKSDPEEIDLQLKALSSLIPTPKTTDLSVDLDLSGIREGTTTVPVRNDAIRLPLGVMLSAVHPTTIKVTTDKKVRRDLPVIVKTIKNLPRTRRLVNIRVDLETVAVEGPERVVNRLTSVHTENIDLSGITQSTTLEEKLLTPAPSVRILQSDKVQVEVDVARK